MMKKLSLLILLVISIFTISACSDDEGSDLSSSSDITTISSDISSNPDTDSSQDDSSDEVASLDETRSTPSKSSNKVSSAPQKSSDKAVPSSINSSKVTSSVAPSNKTVKITVKEGQTLTQIFTKLEENGVSTFDELMKTSQMYDYNYYSLISKQPQNANSCFRLEGYLFPDTYEFYVGEKAQDVIGRFLRNGDKKITEDMRKQAEALGYTMDEVLTVASIIQKEGSKPSEVANVAAVIYNRLKAGQKLQMDSTIVYIEKNVKPFLDGDINRYNSYYNTYKCKALPSGAIANPGMSTIKAALNPSDVPYLYFCHDANANYYYAETYEEHLINLELAGLKEPE